MNLLRLKYKVNLHCQVFDIPMIRTKLIIFTVYFLGLFSFSFAQEVSFELGPDQIGLNETFTIKLTIANDKIKSYDQFPEIQGFQKQGISQSSAMSIINGQMSSTNSIIQYYKPLRKGTFTLGNFGIKINGTAYNSSGKTITVTDAKAQQRSSNSIFDPFDDLFGGRNAEPEYIEIEDEAFFSTSVSKDQIYVGEGVNVSLAFYMPEANQAPFQFYEPGRQLDEILKKLKPSKAWEENFNISSIQPEKVTINGQNWIKYKVFEASFFPFSEGEIVIPSVSWEMIKYKVAKNPTFFGSNRLEDFKKFNSPRKVIKVKPLPPHPRRNEVNVGAFQLRENISKVEVGTGEGFTYRLGIVGEGNINAINTPITQEIQKLNTYDPNIKQQINRGGGKITGVKEFEYYLTINEPGEVNLVNHFEWIYFNPYLEKYDTLRPKAIVEVVGESKVNQAISNSRLGGIYDLIEVEPNKLSNQRFKYYFSILINVLLATAVVLIAVLIVKKR
jgi:hypothetical protein